MKKNTKPTDRKRTFAICGSSALCVAVLAGTYFLTREPETEFIPASTEVSNKTDTWEDHSAVDASLPPTAALESTQLQGTASDNTQTVVSEDDSGSTISLSDSSTREEALQEKPTEPPVTTDDVTDPDKQPEYDRPPSRHPHPCRIIPPTDPGQGLPPGTQVPTAAIPDRSMIRSLAGSPSGTPSRTISTATATSISKSALWAATR